MTSYKIVHIVALALAFAVMLLPFGVHHVTTAPSETSGVMHETVEEYSYFHVAPVLDGNVTPMLTAALTLVLLMLAALSFAFGERRWLHVVLLVLSSIGTTAAFVPLMLYGADGFSPIGLCVGYLLACSIVITVHRMTGTLFCKDDPEDD